MSQKATSSVVLVLASLVAARAHAACEGPAPAEVLSADAIAWLEAPRLTQSLRQKAPTWLHLLVPASAHKALLASAAGGLTLARYRGPSGQPLDSAVLLETRCDVDSEAASQALRSLQRDAGLVPITTPGRVGLASQGRLAVPLQRAATPLVSAPAYQALANVAADLRGHVDVQALFGWLARQKNGRELAGVVDRLGLASAQALRVSASQATLRWELSLAEATRGLLAAAGPAVAQERPAFVPNNAIAFARASVVPSALLNVIYLVAAYQWPVQTALARANIDVAENRAGVRLADDVLGAAPRLLTVYQVPTAGEVATLVALEVADRAAAERFVAAFAELVPAIAPGARVIESKASNTRLTTLAPGRAEQGALHLAVTEQALLVATDLATLKAHLGKKGAAKKLADAPAVAYGFAKDGSWVRALGGGRELAQALGGTTWSLVRKDAGLAGEVTLR